VSAKPPKKLSISGLFLISGTAFFNSAKPQNNKANPKRNSPKYFILEFLKKSIGTAKAKRGSDNADIETLKPNKATNQEVIVVPMFAPSITPADSTNVNNPALTKLTVITV